MINTDAPVKGAELLYTFISHAELRGMSVLRGGASNDEFRKTIGLRLKGRADRNLEGIISIACKDVRRLVASEKIDGRNVGDRLYYVLDTDIAGRPHHADIFATVPRPRNPKVTNKAVWRRQRHHLMELMRGKLERADAFRDGKLAGIIVPHSPNEA